MPPPPDQDLITYLNAQILEAMTAHETLFVDTGIALFRALALILIVWFGVEEALRATSGHGGGFRMDQFARLIIKLAFGFALTHYYLQPMPVIGRSFTHLITDETQYLSTQIGNTMITQVSQIIGSKEGSLQFPSGSDLLNPLSYFDYLIVTVVLALLNVALVLVCCIGYAGEAICVLIGPVLVPFFLIPQLEFLFWNWLKAFLNYAFYQVAANLYVLCFGSLLLKYLGDTRPWTVDVVAEMLGTICVASLLFIFGAFKVPSICASIFSGAAGQSFSAKLGPVS